MVVVVILLFWVLPVALGIHLGNKRGKPAAGFLLPFFFGWLGLLVVACLSDRTPPSITTNVTVINNTKDGE